MKIFLIGYGKMGKRIHELSKHMPLNVSGFTSGSKGLFSEHPGYKEADLVIEFTRPESAYANVRHALRDGKVIVSGTTGWEDKLEDFREEVEQRNGRFFYASNFSTGAHIMFGLNRVLASWIHRNAAYAPHIHEIHHTEKLDKPSGTAKTLASGILEHFDSLRDWSLEESPGKLPISCDRQPGVRGIHEVTYRSQIDEIMIRHEAFSRDGFAQGALDAALWIFSQAPGCYGMNDMLPLRELT